MMFDFDAASPGGKGGANVLFDPSQGLVLLDGVHKNVFLRRCTGSLIADYLRQIGFSHPAVLELYNVEKRTSAVLASGGDGQGTLIGNMLQNAGQDLGGTVVRWDPVPDGNIYHLRVHVVYPESAMNDQNIRHSATLTNRFDWEGDDLVRQFFSPENLRQSPEEYAARHAHEWGCFAFHFYRFRDPELGAWVRRFGEIFSSEKELDSFRSLFLTAEELAEVKRQEAEGF